MTVRWKPLLILSGLFLAIAVLGLLTITYTLAKGSAELLSQARAELESGQFDNALIHLKSAQQRDPQNAEIDLEMARLYQEWRKAGPPQKREERLSEERNHLNQASGRDRNLSESQRVEVWRRLLDIAVERHEMAEAARCAEALSALKPTDPQAAYVLGLSTVEKDAANMPKAKALLATVQEGLKDTPRAAWLGYEVVRHDRPQDSASYLAGARHLAQTEGMELIDAVCLAKLRTIDIRTVGTITEPKERLAETQTRAASVLLVAKAIAEGEPLAPLQLNQLFYVLRETQNHLEIQTGMVEGADDARARTKTMAGEIDALAEAVVQKALSASDSEDIRVDQVYADYLLNRQNLTKCLEVVARALKSDMATNPKLVASTLALKDIAVKAALADVEDSERFAKSAPHIKDLMGSEIVHYSGMGHLYQGSIDLEQSGLANGDAAEATADALRRRDQALEHLKQAAASLPKFSTAQALYGIALILAKEQTLGRQYLKKAADLGTLEARYQLWAAWSMLQAGYPEEAQPIAASLIQALDAKILPETYRTSLLMLQGEIAQSRRSRESLEEAIEFYKKAIASGQQVSPSLRLRLAQILILIGEPAEGRKIIDQLRAAKQGGPAAENLIVRSLIDQGKKEEARQALGEGRKTYPDSVELLLLESSLLVRDGKPADAEKLLDGFLRRRPEEVRVIQERARLLAEDLKRPQDAVEALNAAAARLNNSAPLIQLAMLHLTAKDYKGVEQTITRIRRNWPESAAADMIESQVALSQGDMNQAEALLTEALRKDPTNKMLQYWKAELDAANGSVSESMKTLETLAKSDSVKEVQPGLSLDQAAEAAIVSMKIRSGDVDQAIDRIQDLLQNGGSNEFSKRVRWQLVSAYSSKNDWVNAKKQIEIILNDPKSPATPEDLVQAANQYLAHRDLPAALKHADQALKRSSGGQQAAVMKSLVLNSQGKNDEAAKLLRQTIDAHKPASPSVYLLYAAFQNVLEPKATQGARASKALDEGLAVHSGNMSLIESKYRLMRQTESVEKAVAFLQGLAKDDPDGRYRRLLVDVYREQRRYDDAVGLVVSLQEKEPENKALALARIDLLANQAIQARDASSMDRLRDEAMRLIQSYRTKYPKASEFMEAECELLARKGRFPEAVALAREIESANKASTSGPQIRANLASAMNRPDEIVSAYQELLKRDPRNLMARYRLGQSYLSQGKPDDAEIQAAEILRMSPDAAAGKMLMAQSLLARKSSERVDLENRAKAKLLLQQMIAARPRMIEAYQRLSDVQILDGQRAESIATLRKALEQVPGDGAALAQLIQRLVEDRGGKPAPKTDLDQASAMARASAAPEKDKAGDMALAISMGYGRARKFDQSLIWAEQAAKRSKSMAALINYGSLLLSQGENDPDAPDAPATFRKSIEQYDAVLALDPNSIEAVNNKAWILHRYFKENDKALAVIQSLSDRVSPDALPSEFFDTVGGIRQALGQASEAEKAYQTGLRRSPDDPILNFHLGKLLAQDERRVDAALTYLLKAEASAANRMRPEMAAELKELLARLKNQLARK